MNTQTAITTLHNLSTCDLLSANERAAILAGLAALREAEWLPIETAPQDGTRVQVRVPYVARCGESSGLGWLWYPDGSIVPVNATHWRPIPTPPADAPETEKTT